MLGLLLLASAPAQAQGLPPICEDYPDLEICEDDDDDGGQDDDDDDVGPGGTGSGGAGGDGDGDGNGSLPFTGYPLTGLILLLLILLAAGLALRAGGALRERFSRTAS
jgi:hypothetical protein